MFDPSYQSIPPAVSFWRSREVPCKIKYHIANLFQPLHAGVHEQHPRFQVLLRQLPEFMEIMTFLTAIYFQESGRNLGSRFVSTRGRQILERLANPRVDVFGTFLDVAFSLCC